MMREFGQYSIVTYTHELRGERVNIGVIVWHPAFGAEIKLARNLQRVRCIDDAADLERIRQACEQMQAMLKETQPGGPSPLPDLARQFRHRLIVTPPLNARVNDLAASLERLAASLLAREPFMRASTTALFAKAIAAYLLREMQQRGVTDIRTQFSEEETVQPVTITASYEYASQQYLWRAFSFASLNGTEDQTRLAKAIYAENTELRLLPKYHDARLLLAVQLPKPQWRADWAKSQAWLRRLTDGVGALEDSESIAESLPQLLAAA